MNLIERSWSRLKIALTATIDHHSSRFSRLKVRSLLIASLAMPLAAMPLVAMPLAATPPVTTSLVTTSLVTSDESSPPTAKIAAWMNGWRLRSTLGIQTGGSIHPNQYRRNLGYLTLHATGSIATCDGDLSVRLQGNSIASDPLAGSRAQSSTNNAGYSRNIEILSGYLASSYDSVQIRLGWQKIAWGETFGFYIADLVNPRDYSDPWINDMDWMRRATATAQIKLLTEPVSLEVVVTPLPRTTVAPSRESLLGSDRTSVELLTAEHYPHSMRSIEMGARATWLMPTGSDISLMALHHWNRNLAYELQLGTSGLQLRPVEKQVTSLGISASHSLVDEVLRLDSVLHLRQPWASSSYGHITCQEVWESVIGIDHNFEGGQSLALQLHHDQWSWSNRQAISLRLASEPQPQGIQFELFSYFGLNRCRDIWIQPRATWNPSAAWQVKLQANLFDGNADLWRPDRGVIQPSTGRASLLLWITANF